MAREDLKKKYEAKAAALSNTGPQWGREREREVRLVQDHAVYACMVEAKDQAVGKVLQAIDDSGVSGRTIIVVTSDNGGLSTTEGHPTSNLPLRGGKGWLYEGGVRVPLIVSAPGVTEAESVSDAVVTSPDLYPTLLDLAGKSALSGQHPDGASFIE